MQVRCPKCGDGVLELEVDRYWPGSPASFHAPAEGPEIEFEIQTPCDECGFNTDDLEHLENEEMLKFHDVVIGEHEAELDNARYAEDDSDFDEYMDR
jgi:hypothetical protein